MKYSDDFNPVDDLFNKNNSNQNNSLNTLASNTQNTDSVIQENNESWQNNNVTNTNYNQSIIKDNMINNENINNDINDIQYNQNNNKKRGFNKSIIYFIVGFLLFIVVGIVITNLVIEIIKQKKSNEEEISVLMDSLSVKAVGFEFDQPFDKNKFEYNLEIDTQKVQFKCNKIDSVTGCNETVNLVNKTNLDHIIEYTSQKGKKYSYTFHIIKKDTNGPIKIDSIEFEKTDYSNKSTTVVVKANSDKNKKLKYSFDGGNTWQDDNKYTTDENEDVNVVIKDDDGNTTDPKEIEIDNIDTVAPTVNIEEKEKQESKVILFANAKDDSSGIDKYNWNESGYTNNSTYEATKAGTYAVKVKDKAGNESVKASITIPESYFKKDVKKETHTYKVTFNGNGASVTKGELSCSTTGLSCKIKLPEIKRDNGIIIGYSENANATTPQYKVGQEISVTENKTLYAITAKKITLTINGNGATVKDTEKKCYIYNKKTSCKITTPMISRSGYSIIGFNEDAQAHTEKYKVSSNLNIDKDKTIYAITSKKMTAIFDGNGATISNKNATCNIYNTEKTCSVSIPQITRNGWTIFGVSSNKNSHTAIPAKTVEAGKTYYAITSKKMVATFEGNGATVSNKSVSCYVYNTAETCSVSIPQITRKGWTVLGVSSNKNSHTAIPAKTVEAGKTYYAITKKNITVTFDSKGAETIEYKSKSCTIYNSQTKCKIRIPILNKKGYSSYGYDVLGNETNWPRYHMNETYEFSSNQTLVANYLEKTNHYKNISVYKQFTLGNVLIEIDNSCSNKARFVSDLNTLYSKMPKLFSGKGKLMVLNDTLYVKASKDTVGVTTGYDYYPAVNIKCSTSYVTIVHELTHKYDKEYNIKNGSFIANQSDVASLYNKYYSSYKATKTPFRDYTYSTKYEFLSDITAYYYAKFIIKDSGYSSYSYPNSDEALKIFKKYGIY